MDKKNFFPLFKRCENALVIVFGGGNIAFRRVSSLLNFNLKIKVISPEFTDNFTKISENENLELIKNCYEKKFIQDCLFVLACTNNTEINKEISTVCIEKNIEVNDCSTKENCTFYFPFLINNDVTVGICGDGTDHKKTKKIGDEIRLFLTERID